MGKIIKGPWENNSDQSKKPETKKPYKKVLTEEVLQMARNLGKGQRYKFFWDFDTNNLFIKIYNSYSGFDNSITVKVSRDGTFKTHHLTQMIKELTEEEFMDYFDDDTVLNIKMEIDKIRLKLKQLSKNRDDS